MSTPSSRGKGDACRSFAVTEWHDSDRLLDGQSITIGADRAGTIFPNEDCVSLVLSPDTV
jgi:hypothetical protein